MLANVLGDILVAILDGLLAVTTRRRRQRRAEENVAAGYAPVITGAIRRLSGNRWHKRWRHGLIAVRPEEIAWRPRLRPWPQIRLTGIRVQGRPRRTRWYEEWSLASHLWIYRLRADDQGEYELAVVPESHQLFERQIVRRGVRVTDRYGLTP